MLAAIRTLSHRPCKISVARCRQWLSTETDHKHSYVEEEQVDFFSRHNHAIEPYLVQQWKWKNYIAGLN